MPEALHPPGRGTEGGGNMTVIGVRHQPVAGVAKESHRSGALAAGLARLRVRHRPSESAGPPLFPIARQPGNPPKRLQYRRAKPVLHCSTGFHFLPSERCGAAI